VKRVVLPTLILLDLYLVADLRINRITSLLSFGYFVLPFLIRVILVNIQSVWLYFCHLLVARELLVCACQIGRAFLSLSLDADIWSSKEGLPQYLGLSNLSRACVCAV